MTNYMRMTGKCISCPDSVRNILFDRICTAYMFTGQDKKHTCVQIIVQGDRDVNIKLHVPNFESTETRDDLVTINAGGGTYKCTLC